MKICPKCKYWYEASDFNKNKSKSDGLSTYCRDCAKKCALESARRHRDTQRMYYIQNKERTKDSRREANWRAHGIQLTEVEFHKRLLEQKYKCAICFERPNHRLAVDHDHYTGRVRGLLCKNCNRALGYFKDNMEHLQNAVGYLKLGELVYANR
jgi:hypothetical protein